MRPSSWGDRVFPQRNEVKGLELESARNGDGFVCQNVVKKESPTKIGSPLDRLMIVG